MRKEKASSGQAVDCFFQKKGYHFISRCACSITLQNMSVKDVCMLSMNALWREARVYSEIGPSLPGRVQAPWAAMRTRIPWLQRDGDSFQSELWELPQSAVGPVTTPWPRGQPSLDLENVIETKDQPLLRANRKHHQCGRELLTELRVSPPQGWAVVVRSCHLLGSSHEGTTLMSQAAHMWVAFVLTQYFDLYYFIWESHVPVRFGRSVMIIPIYRWVSNGLKRLGLGSPGGQTTRAHPLFLDSKFGLLSFALQCFSY